MRMSLAQQAERPIQLYLPHYSKALHVPNPHCLQLMTFTLIEKHATGDFWFRACNYGGSDGV